MTQKTLTELYSDINKFHAVIKEIANYFDFPQYILITVLIQNMGFLVHGYTVKEAMKNIYKIKRLVKLIAEYDDTHFTKWVYSEVDMLITGAEMEQDEFDMEDVITQASGFNQEDIF